MATLFARRFKRARVAHKTFLTLSPDVDDEQQL